MDNSISNIKMKSKVLYEEAFFGTLKGNHLVLSEIVSEGPYEGLKVLVMSKNLLPKNKIINIVANENGEYEIYDETFLGRYK